MTGIQDSQAKSKVLVAMSGGVDSSVAALLLLQQGYICAGGTMLLREDIGGNANPVNEARQVAEELHMPFYVDDLQEAFEAAVITPFADAYARGLTPNPCICCNRYLKFGKFLDFARAQGFDAVATGHYARIEQDDLTGRWILRKALDASRDQSYVLYTLTQEQLAHARFPLGKLTKQEVRQIAEKAELHVAHKAESQDICFVPDRNYVGFLEKRQGMSCQPGDFIDSQGRVLGQHKGIERYTIGQHRGLGLVTEKPLYVCAVDPDTRQICLGKSEELFSDTLIARDINLIAESVLTQPVRAGVRIRYRQPEQPALVTQLDENTLQIRFDTPQRAITPGQAVVCYQGDIVLGGGTIVRKV